MEFMPKPLDRAESDALIERIQEHFQRYGFGLWAVEVPGIADFIGFVGLAVPTFDAHFTPCVEVGWRLAFEHWGQGYATEAARHVIAYGFETIGLSQIVSFTTRANVRSQAVMQRLGMYYSPAADFEHPGLAVGHPQRSHVLYRIDNSRPTQ
jgi:RimJ/RimL family protein N-acetyltransferase